MIQCQTGARRDEPDTAACVHNGAPVLEEEGKEGKGLPSLQESDEVRDEVHRHGDKPEEREQNAGEQKPHEVAMVAVAHAVRHPGTVVVELADADVAETAVKRPRWDETVAGGAETDVELEMGHLGQTAQFGPCIDICTVIQGRE